MTSARRFLILAALLALAGAPAAAGPRQDARAGLARALVALKKDDPRTARVELMNAIKADPSLAEARIVQARVLLMLGNGRGAQDELDRAAQLGAPLGPMRHLRAHAALLNGDPEAALREAAAPDADPKERLFRTRITGQALQKLERFPEAAHAFDRALALAPQESALWADIARFNVATGNMAVAQQAADRALSLAPGSVDALTLKGVLARDRYGLTESTRWFDAALKRNPDYVPALTEYAATLIDLGRAGKGLALTPPCAHPCAGPAARLLPSGADRRSGGELHPRAQPARPHPRRARRAGGDPAAERRAAYGDRQCDACRGGAETAARCAAPEHPRPSAPRPGLCRRQPV
jgi:tetratricopeptide (TPR) repeat protein